ncbi:Aspartyl protease [Scheffersomyces spartinae]|uniref:candidapepsin n=1 Tax=Scheffersomyces spartinae TaxID=45513 RepID=A0A9P7VCS2_9ASCO|nr:Aspartyl protease [Scheffersomyces spartinae]KAG7195126.1 Aspartyl protease [Scheffersomyces spartinae]
MRILNVALAIMLAATATLADPIQMNFKVGKPPAGEAVNYLLRRTPEEMPIEHQGSFYMVELEIGSDNQNTTLLIDTGSSDMWVIASDVVCICLECYSQTKRDIAFNPGQIIKHYSKERLDGYGPLYGLANLRPSPTTTDSPNLDKRASSTISYITRDTCTLYGSFDTGTSDSFKENSSVSPFYIAYADGSEAKGVWGTDKVSFGGVSIEDLSFAIGEYSSSNVGVLGIGLMGLESTSYEYLNLPAKMKSEGLIKKNAYSVYLNTPGGKGSVLFGGVDRSKYEGELQTFPMVNTYSNRPQIRLTMALSGLSISVGNNNVSVMDNSYGVLLDTGSTYSYVSSSVLRNIAETLGADYSYKAGAYLLNCPTEDAGTINFDFNGFTLEIPIANFVAPYTRNTCILTLLSKSSSNYFTFGGNFMRSAYCVFDLDDLEISLAKVSHGTNEDIVEIESTIPGAVKAAGYSSTLIASSFKIESEQSVTSLKFSSTRASFARSTLTLDGDTATASSRTTLRGLTSTSTNSPRVNEGSTIHGSNGLLTMLISFFLNSVLL